MSESYVSLFSSSIDSSQPRYQALGDSDSFNSPDFDRWTKKVVLQEKQVSPVSPEVLLFRGEKEEKNTKKLC